MAMKVKKTSRRSKNKPKSSDNGEAFLCKKQMCQTFCLTAFLYIFLRIRHTEIVMLKWRSFMKRKFGMADKLGYMFGDFGNDFAFLLSSMFLLKFYTDVMGVSAAVVGTMMMAARLLDECADRWQYLHF